MNAHSVEKHSLILDAAQKRFAHFGPSKVTMDEIAGDLGMCKAALYYYFPAKEDVYREVIAREQQEFIDRMKEILAKDLLAGKKLQDYILHQLEHFNELVNLKLLGHEAAPNVKPVLGELFKQFGKTEFQLISSIIQQGKESGEMAVDSTEKTAEFIVHCIQGLRLRYAKAARDESSEAVANSAIASDFKLLADLLLNGLIKRNSHSIPSTLS
jgi:TetR/AcrR family transcriptional repressor of mexJK operon